ncbi:hypothetical protein FACS1894141_0030 [Spirochaetia bacterium]|nr:hypothetical protein FACS1894141_0030 [Spirochaetia bacterium]
MTVKEHPVTKHEALFTEPPKGVPQGHAWDGTSVDGPLLGNGDMTGVFAGPPEAPQFWVSTNDFWEQKTDRWYPKAHNIGQGRPRPLGRLVFDIPALKGADMTIRQRFADAQTTAEYTLDRKPVLTLRSFVCATENVLLCTLSAHRDLTVKPLFLFPGELGYGTEKVSHFHRHDAMEAYINNPPAEYREDRGRVLQGYRRFAGTVDQETLLAFAGCFVPPVTASAAEGAPIKLAANDSARYALVLRSAEKTILPQRFAAARAETFTADDAALLENLHKTWWEDYWSVSSVELDDTVMEQRYYLSQYVLGSLCRDPLFPPNIFGVSTWDQPLWNGDYKINYNHQAPFWPLYASGHYEQADCHDAPYLALEGQARQIALKETDHGGVLMPCGLGPKGLVAENMLYHMKSMGAFAVMNMAMRWYTSYDKKYAVKIYSYLRSIVDFWEQDLQFDGQYYHVINDSAHETSSDVDTMDTPSTLGFIHAALRLILDISGELNIDRDKHQKWQGILDKLAPYAVGKADEVHDIFGMPQGKRLAEIFPAQFLRDKEIFLLHRKGQDYSFSCGITLQMIFPAGDVGFNSDPALLKIARNNLDLWIARETHYDEWKLDTVQDRGWNPIGRGSAWNDFNLSCIFFPVAVRIGYDPELIRDALRTLILNRGLPNGFISGNPHGIENLSTVPNTIQEMMLLSYEGVLRFFRCWPKKSVPNAAFTKLRAYGAFVVSGEIRNGTIGDITIYSEKGRRCVFQNPFKKCMVSNAADKTPVQLEENGDVCSFDTNAGDCYILSSRG